MLAFDTEVEAVVDAIFLVHDANDSAPIKNKKNSLFIID